MSDELIRVALDNREVIAVFARVTARMAGKPALMREASQIMLDEVDKLGQDFRGGRGRPERVDAGGVGGDSSRHGGERHRSSSSAPRKPCGSRRKRGHGR